MSESKPPEERGQIPIGPEGGRKYVIVDPLLKHRRLLVCLVILVSVAVAPFALGLTLDRTLKSAYVTSSPAYQVYNEFVEVFGNDEFILVFMAYRQGISDPGFLRALRRITASLEKFPEIAQVISLANLKVFREQDGIFGNYPLFRAQGEPGLPQVPELQRILAAIPITDFLLAKDMKSGGILLRLVPEWRFHPETSGLLERIEKVVMEQAPAGTAVRLVGAPVLREAVQRLTVRTSVIFGILCALVVAVATFYLFKSFRVALITMVVVGLSAYWVMGLMSLLHIALNATTSLSFGLVLVVSVSTIIHIVSHYYEASRHEEDRVTAVRKALAIVMRPCLMCSLTTAVAFATIMVSTIPMVRQLGLVMFLGVLTSFVLALILTPAFLLVLRPVDRRIHERMAEDWISRAFFHVKSFLFAHYRACAASGIIFTIVMLAGAPFIHIDTQILRLFVSSSSELADIRYVEANLTPVRTLELTVELTPGAFKQPQTWKKISELQDRLGKIPEISSVDSMLPLVTYLHQELSGPKATSADLYEKKGIVGEILGVMSWGKDGRELLGRYLNKDFSRIHLSVRTRSTHPTPMGTIIEQVEKTAKSVMGPSAKVVVTGEQAVFAAQASEVVKSQVLSLVLALSAITLLVTLQLRSWILGLISLFPNIPPVAVIIGLMGWTGIPLDNVTVFAVAIAIGLAVDDSIHYLTQLRRDIASSEPGEGRVRRILDQSYQTTAKTLMSTSATLFFGFLALSFTPTQPAIYFGFLGAAAILVALWGDVVFLPSLILTFPALSRLLERQATATAPAAGARAAQTGLTDTGSAS